MLASSSLDADEGGQGRDSRRSRCVASPHCRTAARELLAELGLPAGSPYRWIHVGPIEPRRSPIAVHDGSVVSPDSRWSWRLVPTWPEHRAYPGFSIDLLALRERASLPARRIVVRREGTVEILYVVLAVAWRRADGPSANWRALPTGPQLCF